MEVIAKTEYQDVYKLKDNTFLVVDKFEKMYPDKRITYSGENSLYNPNTNNLYIAKVGHNDRDKEFVKTGTVIFCTTPVISTSDKSKWRYKIRMSGKYFDDITLEIGDASSILNMLSDVEDIIKGEN